MKLTHKRKVVIEAIRRLRHIAISRAIIDEHGKITHEGHPTSGEIEAELNRVYSLAARKAKESSDA